MNMKNYEGLKVVCTEQNLNNGVVGVLTPPIDQLIEDEIYTLQFKIINLNSYNSLDYVKIIDGEKEQSLYDINPNLFKTVGQMKEYEHSSYMLDEKLCYVRFRANFNSEKARVLIGRRCLEIDEVDKPVFLIREISLVKGSVLVPYEERTDDIKRVMRILQSKIDQSAKGITMQVVCMGNQVASNKSSIEMLDNSIKLAVENVETVKGMINTNKSEIELLAGQISSKVSANDVKSIIEQNPNSVKIGFNNINNNIQFNESEMQINSSTGKSLTLKNGRLNTYDDVTNRALGYVGRSTALGSDGTRYPGQVFGGSYNCYYTTFGLDSAYVYDTDITGKSFDPFITLVYWKYNNLSRGIYFNQQTDFNHAPIVTELKLRANPDGSGHKIKTLSFDSNGDLTLNGKKINSRIQNNQYGAIMTGSGVLNPLSGNEWIGYNRSWDRIDCTDLYYTTYNGISTKAIKSDIKYLKNNNIRILSEIESIENNVSRENFYEFIKNIDFATFIYDKEKAKTGNEVLSRESNKEDITCGFIMEDIESIDNPVIDLIVKRTKNKAGEYEEDAVYQKHIDMGAYNNSIAIALQVEIEKREQLEREVENLKQLIKNMKD